MSRVGWHLMLGCLFLFILVDRGWANTIPVAQNDTVRVEQDGRININVLANDFDADGDSLFSRGALTDAQHSRLVIRNTDGTIHYRPELSFVGQDSFAYLIEDGQGGFAGATVYITVFPYYQALNDTLYVRVNETRNLPVLANDQYDSVTDSLFVTGFTPGNHTVRMVVNTDQTIFYDPEDGFLGVDTLSYTSQTRSGRSFGAQVFVHNVLPSQAVDDTFAIRQGERLNLWPVENDWVVPGDSLTFVSFGEASHSERLLRNTNGSLHYRPLADFVGTDHFQYTVADTRGVETSGMVYVLVLALNEAQNDTIELLLGERENIDVIGNDIFYGDTKPQVVGFGLGEQTERVVLNTDGTLHYRPNEGFVGQDTFWYVIETGRAGVLDTARVVVNIRDPNDFFVLQTDSARVFSNQSIVIDPLQNDRHKLDQQMRLTQVDGNGDIVLMSGNRFLFHPTTSFVLVRLTYTVVDDQGRRGKGDVVVLQRPDRAIGFAADDSVIVERDKSVSIDVLANDEGGLHLVAVDAAKHGVAEVIEGMIRYVPENGFEGTDRFVYLVADDAGGQVAARVFVTVTHDDAVLNPPDPVGVRGDFDGDQIVSFGDFVLFATRFGVRTGDPDYDVRMDFDDDGQIAFADFIAFIGVFGNTE